MLEVCSGSRGVFEAEEILKIMPEWQRNNDVALAARHRAVDRAPELNLTHRSPDGYQPRSFTAGNLAVLDSGIEYHAHTPYGDDVLQYSITFFSRYASVRYLFKRS